MDGSAITQLRGSLNRLKQERDELTGDVMDERSIIATMEQELNAYRCQQQLLGGQLRDKELALQDYDRMIKESEIVLQKVPSPTIFPACGKFPTTSADLGRRGQ
jgi:SMC interacting uncharacterized protein involved in chromosome segregation